MLEKADEFDRLPPSFASQQLRGESVLHVVGVVDARLAVAAKTAVVGQREWTLVDDDIGLFGQCREAAAERGVEGARQSHDVSGTFRSDALLVELPVQAIEDGVFRNPMLPKGIGVRDNFVRAVCVRRRKEGHVEPATEIPVQIEVPLLTPAGRGVERREEIGDEQTRIHWLPAEPSRGRARCGLVVVGPIHCPRRAFRSRHDM